MNNEKSKIIIKNYGERFSLRTKGNPPIIAILVQILIDAAIEKGMSKKEFLEGMKTCYEGMLKERNDNNE